MNPDYEIRFLDAFSVRRYLDLSFMDLSLQTLTAASLSDVVRVLLLERYGGVWVDATLFCNRALDSWLAPACRTGFFAFAAPGPDRLLSSWFLAVEQNNRLASLWADAVRAFWKGRTATSDYFWFHHASGDLCASSPEARDLWAAVPKIDAAGPHALQVGDLMFSRDGDARTRVDWTTAVFKLTHRYDEGRCQPGCILHDLLRRHDADGYAAGAPEDARGVNEPALGPIAASSILPPP